MRRPAESPTSPSSNPTGDARRQNRWMAAGLCLALAVITFAVFGQTLSHKFIDYDDNLYVGENTHVQGGLSLKGITWAFTHADCHLYHPLTMLSLMADYQLYGLRAWGYHLTNLLLHTASVLLLFLVLRQMTGALWRSALVAAVFAVHPLRVESVAWVAERKDVLSGLFFMLTLGAYAHCARKPGSPGRYGMVAGAFLLALLSKPTVVTLPVVLLLLDYWPLRRFETPGRLGRLVLEKVPLLAPALGVCAVTVGVTQKLMVPAEDVSVAGRIGNGLVSYAVYLRQMVWPEGLAVPYPYPRHGLLPWEVVLSGTLLAALWVGAWWQHRQRPWLWVGWVWYGVMLLPMAGLFQIGDQAHADRHTYLPQIGIYLGLTWLAAEWGVKWPARRVVFGGLGAALLVVLACCAHHQAAYWRNDESLWRHVLACTGANVFAHNGLGLALDRKGDREGAIEQYREALEIDPRCAEARLNLGVVLDKCGRREEAIAQYDKVLEIDPESAQARYNLGLAYFRMGDMSQAVAQYRQALAIHPDYAEVRGNLAAALFAMGDVDGAIICYRQAIKASPRSADDYVNLGLAYFQKGQSKEAVDAWEQALALKPDQASVQNNLAWLLATVPEAGLRNGAKAVGLAEQARQLSGGANPVVLQTLAAAYAETGRYGEAAATARRALQLAEAQKDGDLAGRLQDQIKLYMAGKPLREAPRPAGNLKAKT